MKLSCDQAPQQSSAVLIQPLQVQPATRQLAAARPGVNLDTRLTAARLCKAKASAMLYGRFRRPSGSGQHFHLGLCTFLRRAGVGGHDHPDFQLHSLTDIKAFCPLPYSPWKLRLQRGLHLKPFWQRDRKACAIVSDAARLSALHPCSQKDQHRAGNLSCFVNLSKRTYERHLTLEERKQICRPSTNQQPKAARC